MISNLLFIVTIIFKILIFITSIVIGVYICLTLAFFVVVAIRKSLDVYGDIMMWIANKIFKDKK